MIFETVQSEIVKILGISEEPDDSQTLASAMTYRQGKYTRSAAIQPKFSDISNNEDSEGGRRLFVSGMSELSPRSLDVIR